jgi:carbon storage regulator
LQLPRLFHWDNKLDDPARRERIMLVLSRRIGEEIVIADDIRVTVVAVKGQRVRIGITAPRSINVARRELLAENSHEAATFGAASNRAES